MMKTKISRKDLKEKAYQNREISKPEVDSSSDMTPAQLNSIIELLDAVYQDYHQTTCHTA